MTPAPRHIVIIDDDPDMQFALRTVLEQDGHRVTCHSTGPAGLAAVRAAPPDLIVLDLMLSTPSEGIHVAYELRRDETLQSIPILVISALGDRVGIDLARDVGSDYLPADAYLPKPLNYDELRQRARQLLAQTEAQRAARHQP